MPITPFHFGPGALLHASAPRHISFLAFCGANVLIDVEPLYFMLSEQYPLHRFFHTIVGATLIVAASLLLFLALKRFANFMPNWGQWRALRLRQVALGAALGSYSHLVFDSIMHSDITPLAPFSNANPLLHLISLSALHWACVWAGIVGIFILLWRHLR